VTPTHQHGWLLLALALALARPVAAQEAAVSAGRPSGEPLVVLAAASLGDVLPRVAELWRARGGGAVELSLAATSRLAPLALEGRADLLITADREWMDWVVERGGAEREGVVDLLGNRLVVAVPLDATSAPSSLADLAALERVALAGETVPAGRYAQSALTAAGAWDAVAPRVVRGESVRSALEWVARGEAEAGIVYQTDLAVHPGVRLAFVVPPELTPEIVYPAAVLASAPEPTEAAAFLEFLRSGAASAEFAAAGFEPASASSGLGSARAAADVAAQSPAAAPTPSTTSALLLSLVVALAATLLGLVPALLLGRLLARRDFLGKTLVTTLILLPLVLPPVVTGFLLLSLLGGRGLFGPALAAVGITVPFTLLAPIVAALVVGLPLYVLSVRGAFEAVDARLEEVAWTLGARPRPAFFRVALPLALPGIAAGATLAFARALGEFGATVVLAGNLEGRTRTIPLAVYSLLEAPGGTRGAWVLAGASVLLSLLALAGFELLSRWQRRRLEELGR
jgi:molybdate transport system permease protein